MMRSFRLAAIALILLTGNALMPTVAFAQTSSISGVVTDTSGAVLPGVTVEARSPALIEQVRSVVSDGEGVYKIVNLRPGTYEVKFSLTGFSTVMRSGVVLETDFNAPVSAQMKVGALEETITVSGQSPVVDTQTTTRRLVLAKEVQEALPTGRSYLHAMATVPAINGGMLKYDVAGGPGAVPAGAVAAYGGLYSDAKLLIDGFDVSALSGTGASGGLYLNDGAYQETVIQTNAGDGETESGGVRTLLIGKQGANKFSGELVTTYANEHMRSSNLDDAQLKAGVTSTARKLQYDFNPSLGGRIMRDRLWFFTSARRWAFNDNVLGRSNPDGTPFVDLNTFVAQVVRITAQVTPKHKFVIAEDYAKKTAPYRLITGLVEPAASRTQRTPTKLLQGKWTATMTNRLLLEAGVHRTWLDSVSTSDPQYRNVVPATCFVAYAACAPGTNYGSIAKQDLITLRQWDAPPNGQSKNFFRTNSFIGSMSYVTGSHALKMGVQQHTGARQAFATANGDLVQRYRNGVVDSVAILNSPLQTETNLNANLGVYVQDSWRLKRLTVNPSLRYDYFHGSIPAQDAPAGRFLPARHFDPIDNVPLYHNISPRVGAAYDLFGDAKTVLKATIGKYVQTEGLTFQESYNPAGAGALASDIRTWRDANTDNIAQEEEIGPSANVNFGKTRTRTPDPDITRPYQVLATFGVERELWPGAGLSVSYNRRRYYNNIFTINRSAPPSVYIPITIADPRGNGQTVTVYNLPSALNGLVDQFDSNSDNNRSTYNGVDVTFNARLHGGGTLLGGVSTGRVIQISCDLEDPNGAAATEASTVTRLDAINYLIPQPQPFCDQSKFDVPFRTTFKMGVNWVLPYGANFSAVLQSQAGEVKNIYYSVGRAIIPTLTQTTVTAILTPPGSSYYPRVNDLDLGVAKTFKFNRLTLAPRLDVFNALNANTVTRENQTIGSTLGLPSAVLTPRLLRIGATVRF